MLSVVVVTHMYTFLKTKSVHFVGCKSCVNLNKEEKYLFSLKAQLLQIKALAFPLIFKIKHSENQLIFFFSSRLHMTSPGGG